MKLAIMQPYFFPCIGYLLLIHALVIWRDVTNRGLVDSDWKVVNLLRSFI